MRAVATKAAATMEEVTTGKTVVTGRYEEQK
jgi:hypothetical protein